MSNYIGSVSVSILHILRTPLLLMFCDGLNFSHSTRALKFCTFQECFSFSCFMNISKHEKFYRHINEKSHTTR